MTSTFATINKISAIVYLLRFSLKNHFSLNKTENIIQPSSSSLSNTIHFLEIPFLIVFFADS